MRERTDLRLFALGIIAVIALVSLIGIGFAYQASYTSGNNSIGYDYVKLNEGQTGSAIVAYVQDFDTYTVNGNVIYRLNLNEDEDVIQLNASTMNIVIDDSRTVSNRYNLTVTSEFPEIFEDSGRTKQCQFVFRLTETFGDENTYYGLYDGTEDEFIFYLDEQKLTNTIMGEGTTVGSLQSGTYHLDVFLKMYTAATDDVIMGSGVMVDGTRFVSAFDADSFPITFSLRSVA